MLRTFLFILILFGSTAVNAQEKPVKIVVEEIPKRLAFYAVNENEQDLDVMLTIKGTNFRQSSAKPRYVRVPATSKVHMKTVVLLRGKKPSYTYTIVVNDSLSKRALKKEYKLIKIKPKKNIIVYITEQCANCDSLLSALSKGKYLFTSHKLVERPEMTEQLQRSFGHTPIDSLKMSIINLGGRLYTKIETYDQLMTELNKE